MSRLLPFAAVLVALAMLALMLVPASLWHSPENDVVYRGFDRNLIYADERGYALVDGDIDISPESLEFTALPNSRPTVHLATTPFELLQVAMDVRVLESEPGGAPFRIGIWSPRANSGYLLEFGPPPDHLITAEAVVNGTAASSLVGGDVVKSEILGHYSPGQLYHLEMGLDKEEGTISSRLSSLEAPPSGGSMLTLGGGPSDPEYGDVVSQLVPVQGGKEYSFGGLVKLVAGLDSYKIAIQWRDKRQAALGFANNWRTVQGLDGWTQREFTATAPPGAAFARMFLGSGNGTQLFFADLFLRETTSSTNLLPNGDFRGGDAGWTVEGHPSSALGIIEPSPAPMESSVTVATLPDLFDSLRVSLTASSFSQSGVTAVFLENYSLTLPHQRFYGAKVDDVRVKALLAGLLAAGGLLCLTQAVLWRRRRRRPVPAMAGYPVSAAEARGKGLRLSPLAMGMLAAALACFVLNALLFGLGSHPFDMLSQRVWAYVAGSSSPAQLYYLPNLVSLAEVWNGGPWHEAVFPYQPAMAYIYALTGWAQRLFFSGPAGFSADTFQVTFLIKSINVLFGLGDALLIYLILREIKTSQRWSLVGAGLFAFNPAVWFSMSVWGQTHVISLFFLLASIWLAQRQRPTWAWLGLAAAALTRPQMLVPAALMGLVLLRRFPLRQNVQATAWSVILTFLFLGPFLVAISPSLPVDIWANQLRFQEGGGNEPAQTVISLGALSVWPLVTYLIEGVSGLARFSYPAVSPLIGDFTYQRISQLVTLGAVLVVAGAVLLRRKPATAMGDHLPLLALSTIAFLMLKTGLASPHMLIGMPFLILCRKSMNNVAYLSLVAIWTVTTLVTMYGSLGGALAASGVETGVPLLHPSDNPVTRLVMDIHSSDWFITVGSLANTLVLVWLAVEALRPLPVSSPQPEPTPQPAAGPAMGEWALARRDGEV
jgi:hypothetical protein